jgi:hypothetical protein
MTPIAEAVKKPGRIPRRALLEVTARALAQQPTACYQKSADHEKEVDR